MKSKGGNTFLLLCAFLLTCAFVSSVKGERLPARIYTSVDGLGSSFINAILRDSRGFMWFCTRDGLSRFDGSRFLTYKIGAENSPPGIEYIYETRRGDYWITTTGGLYRFRPEAFSGPNQTTATVRTLNAQYISAERGYPLEDSAGNLWYSSGKTISLIKERDGRVEFEEVDLNLPAPPDAALSVDEILQADDGSIWIHTSWGVVRRLPDGRIVFYEGATTISPGNMTMLIDSGGKIWAARALELFVINPEPLSSFADAGQMTIKPLKTAHYTAAQTETEIRLPQNPGEILYLTGGDFLSKHYAKDLFQSVDGRIWLSSDRQLIEFDGRLFRRYEVAQGLAAGLAMMAEDAAGNLWIAGRNGLARLDRKGLTSYGTEDGFKSDSVYTINETPDGTLYFADGDFHVHKFDGKKFVSERFGVSPNAASTWTSRYAFLDSRSDWWVLTNEKLFRFAATDLSKPKDVYTTRDGLKDNTMFQVFETSRGEIWVSTRPTRDEGLGLARFIREENRFQSFTEAEGFPPKKSVSSVAEDRHGNLWLGFYESGLARYSNGRFTVYSAGLPGGLVSDLHVDKNGRLWIASSEGGVLRVDDTNAENPQFVHFTTDNGLSSNNIRTLTEDHFGRLYLGSVRGVDRLSPDTNRVKHYSILDGLASDFVTDSHCDKNGVLWFATMGGLSRLIPQQDETPSVPPIRLGSLRIAGVEQPVSELGNTSLEKGELSHTQNNLQIDFFGLDFRAGETLRYQYRLEGADEDWSAPTDLRTVNYSNLSPGSYRFLVRAVNSEGVASVTPAIVSFKILPPVWARWWFLASCALLAALIIILLYRYRTSNLREINAALNERHRAEEELLKSREERLAELEKVRSRIATDLHDDIGASLTQIAVLSEVARQQSKNGNGGAAKPLRLISNVSNELVETMSDIVWSINPSKDHLSDLSQRMRRFASDVLSAKRIGLHFHAPDAASEITINTNLRREVFLIFKESVNNIVKHSGATQVNIELKISGEYLTLAISDNGDGFKSEPPAAAGGFNADNRNAKLYLSATADGSDQAGGNGILSMKKRALEMNGELEIVSNEGKGTTVNLSLPLERHLKI